MIITYTGLYELKEWLKAAPPTNEHFEKGEISKNITF